MRVFGRVTSPLGKGRLRLGISRILEAARNWVEGWDRFDE